MERVNLLLGDDPAVRLLQAVIAASRNKVPRNGPVAEVELTINGVAVPLLPTLMLFYRQVDMEVDRRALEKAVDMLGMSALSGAAEALQNAQVVFRRVLTDTMLKLEKEVTP